MEKLSVVVIAFNESKRIERCLLSVKDLADEIVVVDSFSTDNTAEICRNHGCKVIHEPFRGYIEQKNFALSLANNDWVLSLDADEALSEEAKNEIKDILQKPEMDGYSFNRLNNYAGYWVRFGAWNPDWKLRLWRKSLGKWAGMNPHDRFEMSPGSKIGKCKGNILHWSYDSVQSHYQKAETFSSHASVAYLKAGKRSSWIKIIFSPLIRFCRDYFFKLGFLDGRLGYLIAWITAREVFLKYRKLYQLQKEEL